MAVAPKNEFPPLSQQLAMELIALNRVVAPIEVRISQIKQTLVHSPTSEFVSASGDKVTTSAQTEDRPAGTAYKFDEDKFATLEADTRALLEKMGVVTLMRLTTKGSAPRVTVKLV